MRTLIIGKNSFICSKFKNLTNSKIISYKKLNKFDFSKFNKVLLLSMPKNYKKKISKISFEKNLFKKIRNKRLVYISTSQVYPNKLNNREKILKPQSIYGKNKLKIENEIKKNFKDYLILRAPIIFQKSNYSKKSFFDILNRNFKKNKIFFDISEKSIRDLITLDDLYKCYLKIDKIKLKGTFNIGSKKGLTVKKIVNYYFYKKKMNKNIKISYGKKISNMTLNVERLENKIQKFSNKLYKNVIEELKK